MTRFLLVCLGGAIGSGARYLVSLHAAQGALVVNLIGSFAIGLLASLSLRSDDLRTALMSGVLGGFTTYSAFALQAARDLEHGALWPAVAYVLLTTISCVSLCLLGMALPRWLAPTTVALPEWWGPWQRAKNDAIYAGVLLAASLARLMPLGVLRALGTSGAALGFVFAVADRRRAIRQLRESIPELRRPAWAIFRMFLHLGRLGAEWVKIDRLTAPGSKHLRFDREAIDVVRAALEEGAGVLCVTPHLGNWELLAQAATRHGLPCTTIAKPLYDPRLTRLVDRFRGRSGLVTLWRGDGALRTRLAEVFEKKRLLGVLIDQDTKVAHVFVPFFGRLAATPIVPQRLAMEHGCAIVFGYAAREGASYRVHFERVERPRTSDVEAGARELTARLTALTEAAIRRYPTQWVWLHRRWKTRPPAEE